MSTKNCGRVDRSYIGQTPELILAKWRNDFWSNGGMIFGRMGARFSCARDPQASLSLPLSAAIDLREIHLARQSSLQVPVGHIPVPGGIKLCSPGTFLVANYLIINNGSCQVNFTKPNSATIRYTNSKCPCEDGSEVPVAGVPCRRPVRRTLCHARMPLRCL